MVQLEFDFGPDPGIPGIEVAEFHSAVQRAMFCRVYKYYTFFIR